VPHGWTRVGRISRPMAQVQDRNRPQIARGESGSCELPGGAWPGPGSVRQQRAAEACPAAARARTHRLRTQARTAARTGLAESGVFTGRAWILVQSLGTAPPAGRLRGGGGGGGGSGGTAEAAARRGRGQRARLGRRARGDHACGLARRGACAGRGVALVETGAVVVSRLSRRAQSSWSWRTPPRPRPSRQA